LIAMFIGGERAVMSSKRRLSEFPPEIRFSSVMPGFFRCSLLILKNAV
jgi:hypothetical protein